jgi:hypothetical protein
LFARTITIEARPSVVDDTLRLIREQVYPVTEQRPGMLGALLLADRTKGRIVSITLWETEESMRADDTGKLLQQRISEVSHYITSVMISERFEVALHLGVLA